MKEIEFCILENTQEPDGLGGVIENVEKTYYGYGYLDLITGTNISVQQEALVEQSTHILITDYFYGYEDSIKSDMVVNIDDKYYRITFVDNPMEQNHHLEIYLNYER